MYVPQHFEETRIEVLHGLMAAHPLAAIVTLTPAGLDANHVPFEVDPSPAPFGTLRGHVARANPMWQQFLAGTQALAIFQGPDTYISPSWYASKQETGMVVPTWNYAVVHAHGPLKVIEDRNWLRELVQRLTDRNEAGRNPQWKVTDAPPAFIDRQLEAIIGLEMPIARLTGKWKVSQNRPAGDREGVVDGLIREGGEAAVDIAKMIRL